MPLSADRLGLYISVPFCRSKCTFCNFASGVYPASHHGRYVERLCEELRNARSQADLIGAILPDVLDSIYLGGGTPSILEPEFLHELFATIRQAFDLTEDAEITMECAPGQIDDGVLEAVVECGVNRVSLGVQSFVDREAATTGRLHNRDVALRDIERLRLAGISRLSLDLIAGLPHQTLESWNESLDILLATGVEHASVYMLEIDDESRLGRELLDGGARYHSGAVPKDDTIASMFEQAAKRYEEAGLEQYEISNFAVAGRESKHNLKYWTRAPYLGIGVDAHSMLRRAPVDDEDGRAIRFGYGDVLEAFLEGAAPWQTEGLTRNAELEEAWFLGLRLSCGINLSALKDEYGDAAVERFLPFLHPFADNRLLLIEGDRISLTSRGNVLSNEIFAAILKVGDEEFCRMI